jgi:3-hydroxybutyryl-CoA dehydrogenase
MTIGIVGAGTMGAGIALAALAAGESVLLCDSSPQALDRAKDYIARFLDKKGQIGALDRLTLTSELERLGACEIVIEAITEDLALKQDVFARLSAICSGILATNTSSLSVTAIAAAASHPERAAGMHFFNPAAVMPLVEIVRAAHTSESALNALSDLARRLGKTPVTAADTPGFIVNRAARPFYLESLRIVSEGIAAPHQIDALLRLIGFKLGAFELMDMIGLDVSLAASQAIFEATFYEPRYRPSLIQAKMVQAGMLGRKTERGFYDYRNGAPGFVMPDLPAYDGDLLLDAVKALGGADSDAEDRLAAWCAAHGAFTADAALSTARIVCALINEAAFIVGDGVTDPDTLDTAVKLGLNYPKGLFEWGRELGFARVIAVMRALHAAYMEERYRTAPLLRRQQTMPRAATSQISST